MSTKGPTSPRKSSRRSRGKKQNRRTRAVRLMALSLSLCACLIAVLAATLYIRSRRARTLDVQAPFQTMTEEAAWEGPRGTAEPFAATLIVTEDQVGQDLLQLSEAGERAFLGNLSNGSALYASGIYDRIYPASLTKIMTGLIAGEEGNLDDVITMQEADFDLGEGAQTSDLLAGDTLTMRDLLRLLLVYSANEAANAIARHMSGSPKAFVQKMNEKAAILGMTGTHFSNPHGLHESDHYTTIYDIYLMLQAAGQNETFCAAASMNQVQVQVTGADGTERSFVMPSTDEYFTHQYSLPPDIAVLASKTGTTDEAGSCLALLVQNGSGVPWIAIVTGASTKDILYGDMTALLTLAGGA